MKVFRVEGKLLSLSGLLKKLYANHRHKKESNCHMLSEMKSDRGFTRKIDRFLHCSVPTINLVLSRRFCALLLLFLAIKQLATMFMRLGFSAPGFHATVFVSLNDT